MRLKFLAIAATVAVPLTVVASLATAQDVGVAVCDKFLKTYESCVAAKAPAAQASQMRSSIDALRANFRKVAETADGKKQLETVCKQTADQLKQQVASLNCSW